MNFLFILSKYDVELAKAEIARLLSVKKGKLSGDMLIADIPPRFSKLFNRLAYTREVYQVLFKSTSKKLEEDCAKFNWSKIIDKTYSVGTLHRPEIVKGIRNKLSKAKVNIRKPDASIRVFTTGRTIYVGKQVHYFDKKILQRKSHLRPEQHPTSLDPRLARCAINLTGALKGSVLDPFCGAGGILIEAGTMELKPVGIDIDSKLIKKAMANLNHYGIKDYKLFTSDALKFPKLVKRPFVVVTDLPYGKGSRVSSDLSILYLDFGKLLYDAMKKGEYAVIMFPDFVNDDFLKKFRTVKKFEQYLHKSLTKKIYLITKS